MKAIFALLLLSLTSICNGQESTSKFRTSFINFVELTNASSEIPEELIIKHLGESWVDENDDQRYFSGDHFASFKMGEITFAALNFGHHGVCSETILFSFDVKGKLISHLTIDSGCDQPLDERVMEGTSFKLFPNNILAVIDYKFVAIGDPLRESDFSANENDEYEKYSIYSILPDGNFSLLEYTDYISIKSENPDPSKQLLSNQNLKKYTPQELRILRNEIFAKKGYIFKSADLRQHFKKFDWYTPISKDVSESLSILEKLNIQTLLITEQERKVSVDKATIVLDGYFLQIDKESFHKLVDIFRIKETKYIDPDSAYKNTGLIWRNGLLLISTDLSSKEIFSSFSKHMNQDRIPVYIINESDTINNFRGINPVSIDSIVPIPPYKAALKYGHRFNGGIIKIYTKN
jgi:hypothetical protein